MCRYGFLRKLSDQNTPFIGKNPAGDPARSISQAFTFPLLWYGVAKRPNEKLELKLQKAVHETKCPWTKCLPIALNVISIVWSGP